MAVGSSPTTPAIFCSLESPEVDALFAQAPVTDLGPSDVVGPAQVVGACLLVIESGLALIRAEQPGTFREVVVCHAGPGSILLPPQAGEAVAALVPTRLMLLTPALRDRLLEAPGAAPLLFDALAATVRQKHRTIAALARPHHLDRVRAKLLQLASEHGIVGRDGIRLDLPLTHALLAEMTGSARETVTRAIDELQEEGLVVRRGRSYRLRIDPDNL